MSTNLHNFKCWHSDILESLYENGNAGFAILMLAFPLLERYLREKSSVHEELVLTDTFYEELRRIFPALRDTPTAKRFWHVYRNGLLHQVTLSQRTPAGIKMPDAWLNSTSDAVAVALSGDIWVHPVKFARKIVETIEADFTTFEGEHSVNHTLPIVHTHSSGTAKPIPFSVPITGSKVK